MIFRPLKVLESVILSVEIRILHLSFLRFSTAKPFLVLVGTAIILCNDKRYLCFYLLEAIQSVVIAVVSVNYHITSLFPPYPTLPFSMTPSSLSPLLSFPSLSLPLLRSLLYHSLSFHFSLSFPFLLYRSLSFPSLPFSITPSPSTFPSPLLPFPSPSLSHSRPCKNLRNSIYLTYLMKCNVSDLSSPQGHLQCRR
jgi:hypothetical protein